MTKEETTFYRFYSEIKAFLIKLLDKPIQAKPSKYLEDRELTKDRLIKLLMKNGILERNEKILTPNKDGVKNVQYNVKYTLKTSIDDSNNTTFENKIEKIHDKYFGKSTNILKEELDMFSCPNIVGVVTGKGGGVGSEMCDRWARYVNDNKNKKRNIFKEKEDMNENNMTNNNNSIFQGFSDIFGWDGKSGFRRDDDEVEKKSTTKKNSKAKKNIKECDCGGCCDGGDIAGATNTESSGQFTQPFGGVQRRDMLANKQKKDKGYVDPTKILGKTINETHKKRVMFTESQMQYIAEKNDFDLDEATTCGSVGADTTRGDMGYDTPAFNAKKNDEF